MKLPEKILAAYKERCHDDSPLHTLRALTDIVGNLGETYMLSDGKSILFCSAGLGENHHYYSHEIKDVLIKSLREERPFAYLDLKSQNNDMKLKFAAYDIGELNQMLKNCGECQESSTDENIYSSLPDLTPTVGLCAALQAVSHINQDVSLHEMKTLEVIMPDPGLLQKGLLYWKYVGNDRLISELTTLLSDDQKKCLLANLLEVAMADGVLKIEEKKFLEQMRKEFSIDATEFNTVFDILVIKNNLSVFYPD